MISSTRTTSPALTATQIIPARVTSVGPDWSGDCFRGERLGLDGVFITGCEPRCGPVDGLGTGLTATFSPHKPERSIRTGRILTDYSSPRARVLCPVRSPTCPQCGKAAVIRHARAVPDGRGHDRARESGRPDSVQVADPTQGRSRRCGRGSVAARSGSLWCPDRPGFSHHEGSLVCPRAARWGVGSEAGAVSSQLAIDFGVEAGGLVKGDERRAETVAPRLREPLEHFFPAVAWTSAGIVLYSPPPPGARVADPRVEARTVAFGRGSVIDPPACCRGHPRRAGLGRGRGCGRRAV